MTKNIIKKVAAVLSVIAVFAVSQAYAVGGKPPPRVTGKITTGATVHAVAFEGAYEATDGGTDAPDQTQ